MKVFCVISMQGNALSVSSVKFITLPLLSFQLKQCLLGRKTLEVLKTTFCIFPETEPHFFFVFAEIIIKTLNGRIPANRSLSRPGSVPSTWSVRATWSIRATRRIPARIPSSWRLPASRSRVLPTSSRRRSVLSKSPCGQPARIPPALSGPAPNGPATDGPTASYLEAGQLPAGTRVLDSDQPADR